MTPEEWTESEHGKWTPQEYTNLTAIAAAKAEDLPKQEARLAKFKEELAKNPVNWEASHDYSPNDMAVFASRETNVGEAQKSIDSETVSRDNMLAFAAGKLEWAQVSGSLGRGVNDAMSTGGVDGDAVKQALIDAGF